LCWETQLHAHTKQLVKLYSFVYFNLQVYREEMGRQNIY
jgi:hypothetical protein